MLTEKQISYFNTFGFLLLREAFLPDEMAEITREVERLLQATESGTDDPDYKSVSPFMEEDRLLIHLPEDDRLYEAAGQLLGPGFVWGDRKVTRAAADTGRSTAGTATASVRST